MNDVIVTGFKNAGPQGVTLILNRPAPLKRGGMPSKEWWLSWDKIGAALIENYADADSVADLNKLRESPTGENRG
jgi:hypothetical protein